LVFSQSLPRLKRLTAFLEKPTKSVFGSPPQIKGKTDFSIVFKDLQYSYKDMQNFPTELVTPTDRRFLTREQATPELLNIAGVDPVWIEHVRILDRKGKLALIHYLTHNKSMLDFNLDEEPLKSVGSLRGVIIDTATDRVVCRSFPYTPEILVGDEDRMKQVELSSATFFRSCEGTVIRVFWFDGNWYISTHRKIDAANSSWSGATFGEMFSKLCQFDFNSLNRNWAYMFLMSHPDNRLVYSIPTGQLMLTAIYDQNSQHFVPSAEWGELPTGTIKPTAVTGILSIEDVVKTTNQFASFDASGLIVLSDEKDPKPVKIINSKYNDIRNARGNDPNLRTRYINAYGSKDATLLKSWYTEDEQVFSNVDKEIEALVLKLYSMYVDRNIKKNYVQIPKQEHVILKRCHEWHIQNRIKNIISLKKVREILDDTPTYVLLILLNRQKSEE
jgi:hypothetical protein